MQTPIIPYDHPCWEEVYMQATAHLTKDADFFPNWGKVFDEIDNYMGRKIDHNL